MGKITDNGKLAKRVGIWVRVSTEDQARGESPQHHEQRGRYYAEAKAWQVVEVYRLEGVSGKAVKDHGETRRMLADIQRGHVTALIFSKLARLARNTRDLLDFADIFHAHGADLISLQEAIDTSTAAGRLFFTIVAAMAEWERAEIAERVAASVPVRAKLGKPLGGQAPYGYDWQDGRLVVNPNEAPVRKQMYELFLQHRRKKSVARLLNEAGYRTRKSGLWSDTTIDRLLKDPTAKGIRRANYTKSTGDKKHWVPKPENEWVLTEVEAIVSEELWDQCNLILEDRRKQNAKRPGKKPVHLFAGIAVCHCGQKMYVPSNTPKYVCQKCRNKIPVADLEGVYFEELKGFFHSSTDITELLADANREIADREQLVKKLEREKVQVETDMDTLFDLHRKGEIPTQGFGKRYNPLQERLNQLEDEIPRLQAEVDYLKVNLLSADDVLYEAKDLYDRWPRLDPDDRRRIVEHITDQIVVGQNDIEIHLAYVPVASELVANCPRNFIVVLPLCRRRLSAAKPKPYGYPTVPQTIGEHLRKRRLDLQLLQREVAVIIGVDKATVENWEYGNTSPNLRAWPGVIKFLGYDPRPQATTIGEQLRRHREGLGLSWAEAAKLMGVDPSTVTKWELQPDARQNHLSIPKFIKFLGYNPMPEPRTPAEHIRYIRLTLGLTQQHLAERLGVCQDKVWRWETGRQEPPDHAFSLPLSSVPLPIPSIREVSVGGAENPSS